MFYLLFCNCSWSKLGRNYVMKLSVKVAVNISFHNYKFANNKSILYFCRLSHQSMRVPVCANLTLCFLLLSFLFFANSEIINRNEVIQPRISLGPVKTRLNVIQPPIEPVLKPPKKPTTIDSASKISLQIKPSLNIIKLLNPDTATTYKGITQINIPNGQSNQAIYFISFSSFTDNCDYIDCFYGWVDNYTITGADLVQGYPATTDPIKPVFMFKTRSKTDFVIVRHPQLTDAFVNIIEVGCQLLEPTIKTVSLNKDSFSTSFVSGGARFLAFSAGPTTSAQYAFIPQADFNRIKPRDTLSIDPTAFKVRPDTISGIKIIKPDIFINPAPNIVAEDYRIASVSKKLIFDNDLVTKQNDLQEKITVDRNYFIVSRSRTVDLNIPSDSYNDEDKPVDFISNIKIQFDRSGNQSTNNGELQKYLDSFTLSTVNIDTFAFSNVNIEARRIDVNKIKFYNQAFIKQYKVSKYPLDLALFDPKLISNIGSINLCGLASISSPSQISIFLYTKQLFSKTILGKKFSVTIKIQATLLNYKNIRFKGSLIYALFGNQKEVEIFNYVKDISFNWSKSYDLGGSWSFSIYIPLPPPVSFLGINFSFGVSFSIHVDIFAKGNPDIKACLYAFEMGSIASTGVGVDASAAVRAIAIEGGVYISGTLVKLSTDPRFALTINLSTKAVITHVTWYLYLNAFSFEWGFFYRYWTFWSGWSGRKTIAKWPIKGISQQYLIYKS